MTRALKTLIAACALTLPAAAGSEPVRVGAHAPDLVLHRVDGGVVRLSDLRGQVVVLNFWATWCVPCREELPLLDAYAKAHRKESVEIFAVSAELLPPAPARVRNIFARLAIPPVTMTQGPYGVITGLPTNYVIDRAGVVRFARSGAFDRAALDRIVTPLLAR